MLFKKMSAVKWKYPGHISNEYCAGTTRTLLVSKLQASFGARSLVVHKVPVYRRVL